MSDNTSTEIALLTQQLQGDALTTWTDEKRKDFTNTFQKRVNVARYILIETAETIWHMALGKHFVSEKHRKLLPTHFNICPDDVFDYGKGSWSYDHKLESVGGRPLTELNEIAKERALAIIDKLPQLNEAVRILSPEVGKMIEKRTVLLKKGKSLMAEAEEVSGPLDMDDLDQEMTISEFRAQVKEREKKRKSILQKLDEVGDEGNQLEGRINKFLYDGLPGLSEAVIKVITEYVDRSLAMAAMNRRVAEQVQFGDSEAALEMLKTFEKDETKVSSAIQEQFDQALEQLKIAAKKGLGAKQLKKLKGA